ncbi:hypothetical protein Ami103574_09630 [Aminipila butyrica]|uniref:Uncharacterized protein n=1 Tax=Aminipila butyrica TaxID=433296 RepID=A0A858BZQ0_9FIRM|nr:hypothetical protein [Aminipila butyrica]QIB69576.1 hypothetical protein Ami103574_09630 [Aminipila butyrica]
MEMKRFNLLVGLTALLSAVLASVLYFSGTVTDFYWGWYVPFDWIAALLRSLSLHSVVGNVISWVLYVMFCLSPAGPVAIRVLRNRGIKGDRLAEALLLTLSLYLFFAMYCYINPGALTLLLPEVPGSEWMESLPWIKGLLAAVGYSLLLGYGILRLAGSISGADLHRRIQGLLIGGTVAYVALICFILSLELFQQLEALKGYAFAGVVFFNCFLKLLPLACMVSILQTAVQLVCELKTDKFGTGAAKMARLMAERSRRTVLAAVCCGVIRHGIQLIFWRELRQVNILLEIPFLPLILAFAGLLLAEYFQESAALYKENQMII